MQSSRSLLGAASLVNLCITLRPLLFPRTEPPLRTEPGHNVCLSWFVGCITTLSVSDLHAVDCWDDIWIEKDPEGSGCGLITGHYPDICLEGLRRNKKSLVRLAAVPRSGFEPNTSRIEVQSVAATPANSMSKSGICLFVCYITRMSVSR
jgi:hypothetical protein